VPGEKWSEVGAALRRGDDVGNDLADAGTSEELEWRGDEAVVDERKDREENELGGPGNRRVAKVEALGGWCSENAEDLNLGEGVIEVVELAVDQAVGIQVDNGGVLLEESGPALAFVVILAPVFILHVHARRKVRKARVVADDANKRVSVRVHEVLVERVEDVIVVLGFHTEIVKLGGTDYDLLVQKRVDALLHSLAGRTEGEPRFRIRENIIEDLGVRALVERGVGVRVLVDDACGVSLKGRKFGIL